MQFMLEDACGIHHNRIRRQDVQELDFCNLYNVFARSAKIRSSKFRQGDTGTLYGMSAK